MATGVSGVEIRGPLDGRLPEVLTAEAVAFLGDLHRRFNPTRLELLERRRQRYASGEMPDFLPETREIREGDWEVAAAPADLQDRRVEITGPTDRKMVINALNSGARGFMADFEDSNSPTWENMVGGQVNLIDAIEGSIELQTEDKTYRLEDRTATLLIETIPAAFEMEESLHELREHSAGLNAGRWDYIFSMIKCFRDRPEFVLPDRSKVTMTVPFMHAYTELLVKTCHRRGAHAMGGMAAFIPSRKRPEINEEAIAGVREDKRREAGAGFDGTWVAHPDLVPVATEEFEAELGERPNQVDRRRDEVD